MKKLIYSTFIFLFFITSISNSIAVTREGFYYDVIGHWSEDYVEELVDKGILSVEHRTFRPDHLIMRAELVKMVVEATEGTISEYVPSTPTYPDVPKDHWAYEYIETGTKLYIINGFQDGLFKPDLPISREQALKVVLNAFGVTKKNVKKLPFLDVEDDRWSRQYITTAYAQCMISGKSQHKFDPESGITRAEAAKMIVNAIEITEGKVLCGV